jgi:NAD(P)H dehydrogenase (quinone)
VRAVASGRTARSAIAATAGPGLSSAGIADIASQLSGHPITRVTVTDEQYRAGLISHGVPGPQADMLAGLFAASRQGEFAAVDPTLERLLGRRPLSMRDVLAASLPS